MRTWNNLVVGLAATLVSGTSVAGNVTYEVYFPPTLATMDINGSMGANTARSFMGAARMSIQAFKNVVPPDENSILGSCRAYTPSPNYWPESCNPDGMKSALSNGGWGSWISSIYSETQQAAALSQQIGTLRSYRSPNIVPIYGQGDHWVMVHKMVVDDVTNNVVGVVFRDGGPAGDWDSSFNSYDDGQRSASGATWSTTYYRVLTSIGPSDTYYNKYVVLWDPPPNSPPSDVQPYRAKEPVSPLPRGQRSTARLAQQNAIESLRLGGLDATDAEMWSVLSQATPWHPYEVHGVYPDGSEWNYYLVPFLDSRRMLVGMAMLDKETAAYQQAWVLPQARRFTGVDHSQARGLAQSHAGLKGDETLDEGILTWDPSTDGSVSRSPMRPYYEFRVKGPNGEDRGSVAVRLDSGNTHRVSPCKVSRRAARSLSCAE
ncbi:MAG TPA: hypothetical protein VE057_13200 [Archangium sp.]|nr:hypothetical protein [Archangium sp.]